MLRIEWIKYVGVSSLLLMTWTGCGSSQEERREEVEVVEPQPMAPVETVEAPVTLPEAAPVTPAAPPVAAIPAPKTSSEAPTDNQLTYDQAVPGVSLKIVSPTQDQILDSNAEVEIKLELTGYATGTEIGQHVHVVVDNQPYLAHYDMSQPVVLKNLEPGTHTVRVFPSRHYHLALKQGDVFKTVTFHVGGKTEGYSFDPKKPYITYSRPKGEYKVKDVQSGLLLDFYVTNAKLGKDAKVIYGVNGQEKELTSWKPILLPALPVGEHKISLKLIDMKGKVIPNADFNDTTRTVTIVE